MSHLKHTLLGILALLAVATSWHRTYSSNAWGQEERAFEDLSRYWSTTLLRHELQSTDFDASSKELYPKLLGQESAWQTGLIHYLNLNRFTGKVNPAVNRTVRWSKTIRGNDGKAYRLYLADLDHRKYSNPSTDGAAYIVTDSEFNLVYWRGTSIRGNMTSGYKLVGDQLPVRLTLREDSVHNGDSSLGTYSLSLDGIRPAEQTNGR